MSACERRLARVSVRSHGHARRRSRRLHTGGGCVLTRRPSRTHRRRFVNTTARGGGIRRCGVVGCRHRRGFVHASTGRGGYGCRVLGSWRRRRFVEATGMGRSGSIDRRSPRAGPAPSTCPRPLSRRRLGRPYRRARFWWSHGRSCGRDFAGLDIDRVEIASNAGTLCGNTRFRSGTENSLTGASHLTFSPSRL